MEKERKMKEWSFLAKRQIVQVFDKWLGGFCIRQSITLRRKTNLSHKKSKQFTAKFCQKLLRKKIWSI